MNGMREWKILKNVLCANATSSHHINQSPAIILSRIKEGKGGDV